MVGDNGSNDGLEVKVKMCPLLKEWCTKDVADRCTLHSELTRNIGGLQQKFGICAFNAVVIMLSEINQKTQVSPQQKLQLPKGLMRG